MTGRSELPTSAETVVVGAGALGLFSALFLARAGQEVVVLDRSAGWTEASGVNAGSLAVQNKLIPLIPYTLDALPMWRGLEADLGADVGFRSAGGYKIATTEQEAERLRRSADELARVDAPVRWLGQADLLSEAPWLGSAVVAGTFSPDDSYANPLLLGPALKRAVRAAGARIVADTTVRNLVENGAIEVETSRGTIRSGRLLLAAGAWSGGLAAKLGAHLPISLDVNMVSVTEPAPPTIGRIVTHARGILTLKQAANGTCLIGGGWQGGGTLADDRKELDYESLIHNLRLAARVVPGLVPLNLVRTWSGYEGVTPDSLPYLGRLSGSRNAFVLACARGGWTLSPCLGRLMSELICRGETSAPIGPFAPGRFGNA